MLDFETSNSKLKVSKSNSWKNYFFLENYVTSEGAVSHNVLYHQQLPITCYQVRFYADNYFESLPIVSTAFKPMFVWERLVASLVFVSNVGVCHTPSSGRSSINKLCCISIYLKQRFDHFRCFFFLLSVSRWRIPMRIWFGMRAARSCLQRVTRLLRPLRRIELSR